MSNDLFQKDYAKRLETVENKTAPKIAGYYLKQYNKGIDNFINTGETNYQYLFNFGTVKEIYQNLYTNVGLYFARWYYNNYKKYLNKTTGISKNIPIWTSYFTDYANKVAATNVSLVSGTAKKTLVKVTQRLMSDPELAMLGADQKARILKNQFKQYSKSQATRLVRTESNRIANFATEQSALSLFGQENLQKTWIHSLGPNERPSHVALHLTSVDFNQPFMVGGEPMQRPGEGSAENIINCRCSVNYEPKPIQDSDMLIGIGAAYLVGQLVGEN